MSLMKKENIAPKLKSTLDTKSEQFIKNKEMMLDKLKFLDGLLAVSYTHLTLPTK